MQQSDLVQLGDTTSISATQCHSSWKFIEPIFCQFVAGLCRSFSLEQLAKWENPIGDVSCG
jgi:hypothetical protein